MEQEYFKLDFTVINIGNYYLHPQLNRIEYLFRPADHTRYGTRQEIQIKTTKQSTNTQKNSLTNIVSTVYMYMHLSQSPNWSLELLADA